jgi:hypothetical protein
MRNKFLYTFGILFVEEAAKNGKLNPEEMRLLKLSMEVVTDTDRIPKQDVSAIPDLKKEFKCLKIENHRDLKETKAAEPVDTHYGENRYSDNHSQYEAWKSFWARPDFDKYKRSYSQKGMWRTTSGNYRRALSGSSSCPSPGQGYSAGRPFDRSRSQRRYDRTDQSGGKSNDRWKKQKDHPKLMDRVNKIEDGLGDLKKTVESETKEMKKSLEDLIEQVKKSPKSTHFINEHFKKDESIVNVNLENISLFLENSTAVDVITLDLGAPRSMVGMTWLNNYLKKNGMEMSDLKVSRCSQKFRFGHGGLHESVQEVELPVTVKYSGDGSDVFKKIYLKVHVVDADNVPLLCGMNDLSAWQSIVDTGTSTLKVDWG